MISILLIMLVKNKAIIILLCDSTTHRRTIKFDAHTFAQTNAKVKGLKHYIRENFDSRLILKQSNTIRSNIEI
jgi:hypothetical protein